VNHHREAGSGRDDRTADRRSCPQLPHGLPHDEFPLVTVPAQPGGTSAGIVAPYSLAGPVEQCRMGGDLTHPLGKKLPLRRSCAGIGHTSLKLDVTACSLRPARRGPARRRSAREGLARRAWQGTGPQSTPQRLTAVGD
jgi:hypothetical protein